MVSGGASELVHDLLLARVDQVYAELAFWWGGWLVWAASAAAAAWIDVSCGEA